MIDVPIFSGNESNINVSFLDPMGLAKDSKTNTIFIASSDTHSIVAYPSGKVVAGGNGPGNTSFHLNYPEGLFYDEITSSFIISNRHGHSVMRWTIGSMNGTLIGGTPGIPGNVSSKLNNPIGVTMDPMGNVYVADYTNDRIQLYVNGEGPAQTITGLQVNGTRLIGPTWLRLDTQLNLFVSQFSQNRIVKFSRY